jgi:hypothetical protein
MIKGLNMVENCMDGGTHNIFRMSHKINMQI